MSDVSKFISGPYELSCSAQPLANGNFLPKLTITKIEWMARPRTIAIEKGSFAQRDEAVAAAHATGLEWIKNYG